MIKALLLLDGIVFGAIGLVYSVTPHLGAGWLALQLTTVRGLIDFRATYGGLDLGLGIFFILCARKPALHAGGLWAGLCALIGFFVLRTYGLVTDGSDPLMIQLAVAEALMVALHVLAIRRL